MTQHDIIAFFPQAWLLEPDSLELHNGYHDVPWTEPALVRELVRLPWPERSWLSRRIDRSSTDHRLAKPWVTSTLQPTTAMARGAQPLPLGVSSLPIKW